MQFLINLIKFYNSNYPINSTVTLFCSLFATAFITVLISFINTKSLKSRKVITGKPLILFDNGRLYRNNFKKSKLDLNEFLMLCRNGGYFNLSDLETVLLEPNGKLSFLPVSDKRPVTPTDLNLSFPNERLTTNVILDGKVVITNLLETGNDEIWLQKQLNSQGFDDVNEIFLATCDSNNNLSVYKKYNINS